MGGPLPSASVSGTLATAVKLNRHVRAIQNRRTLLSFLHSIILLLVAVVTIRGPPTCHEFRAQHVNLFLVEPAP